MAHQLRMGRFQRSYFTLEQSNLRPFLAFTFCEMETKGIAVDIKKEFHHISILLGTQQFHNS